MKFHSVFILIAVFLCFPSSSFAHKPSDSYLRIDLGDNTIKGQWDVALRDLDYALAIDTNNDGEITWGELRVRHDEISAYLISRLTVQTGQKQCLIQTNQQLVDNHSDGAYAVLRFSLDCPEENSPLILNYRLFFKLDPTHRGILRINSIQGTQATVLSPTHSRIELKPASQTTQLPFITFWREGIWHIWIGFDHILFLIALLLPTVMRKKERNWIEVPTFRPVLLTVLGVVTAFTIAHSITLTLAMLSWVSLPSRWVESAIAATVILAAINNIYPIVSKRRYLIAFFLGLIHGFGFASVLNDLEIHNSTLAVVLLGFNLGVETGQLVIVATFLPLAFLMRSTWAYQQIGLRLGSFSIAIIATIWLLERSLNWRILSWL